MSSQSATIHNVLEAACKSLALDPALYARGPKPLLHSPAYLALVIWIAEQVLPKIEKDERATVEEMLGFARRQVAREKLGRATQERVSRFANKVEVAPVGIELARAIATETQQCFINDNCGKATRVAVVIAARILGESMLAPLEEQIERLDAVTLIERQKLDVKETIAASLWRGTTGAKVTHVLVRLADGRYGLIAKTKGRWSWTVGDRDDILATVPDVQMAAAVGAVLGGGAPEQKRAAKTTSTTRGEIAKLPGRLGGVAIGSDGRCWAATRDGRLVEWTDEVRIGTTKVGVVDGMSAGTNGLVVTWGEALTRWNEGKPERLKAEAEGALVLDDGTIVHWKRQTIQFGKKKARGPGAEQRLCFDLRRKQVVALAANVIRRFHLDGSVDTDLPLPMRHASLAPECTKVATWDHAAKGRVVKVCNLDDGEVQLTLEVDSGHIDRVVFALDRILVRHHEKKRVTIFDASGNRIHRMQARDLGDRGSVAEELFPLLRGQVLAFAPYPKGQTLLVDEHEQLVSSWYLERFYTGGKSLIADAGDRVLFAHFKDSTRALRF